MTEPQTESRVTAETKYAQLGQLLRSVREQHGLSLETVAHALKLTVYQVQAIEEERYSQLPGITFARGFLRNYIHFLGLDDNHEVIALLKADSPEQDVSRLHSLATGDHGVLPDSEPEQKSGGKLLFFILIIIIVIGLLGWHFDWFDAALQRHTETRLSEPHSNAGTASIDSSPVSFAQGERIAPDGRTMRHQAVAVQPVVVNSEPSVSLFPADDSHQNEDNHRNENNQQNAQAEAGSSVTLPVEDNPETDNVLAMGQEEPNGNAGAVAGQEVANAAEPLQSGRLVFNVKKESSWLQVRDGRGDMLFSGTVAAGTSRVMQGVPPFSVVVGNVPEVDLLFNDKPVDLQSKATSGVVRLTLN